MKKLLIPMQSLGDMYALNGSCSCNPIAAADLM